ncbi:3,4-dioxygenase subunit beta [Nocardioides sp. P86]|uniref:dioxygenase family protein n=1 Tax=Nocardioides sp. P86 TaxID=2939569 RepID=UPI00203C7F42|nr:3,4-dioxygenase subunit beta [Nocardioides sp. P86]MCM3514447.1 3,4-dioxygenase subunit beta [Nocardioides sp. P86]
MSEHRHDESHDHDDPFDQGLAHDLVVLREQQRRRRNRHHRRAVLGMLGVGGAGAGAAALLSGGSAATAALARVTSQACTVEEIPGETAGPYPGDGSNGPDVLVEDGIVRRDLRASIGDAAGTTGSTAEGVDLRIRLTLTDTATCAPAAGLAVYAWHCDREGRYSIYSPGIEDQNYLRGVQVSGAKGRMGFRTIWPACYPGRWPHVHVEVFRSVDDATGGGDPVATSQLALPRRQCMAVYRRAEGYSASVANLERVSLGSYGVFGDDGGVRQLASVSGSVERGFRARLTVPVDL